MDNGTIVCLAFTRENKEREFASALGRRRDQNEWDAQFRFSRRCSSHEQATGKLYSETVMCLILSSWFAVTFQTEHVLHAVDAGVSLSTYARMRLAWQATCHETDQ